MVNVDLNALEIGSVLLLERNHEIQVGIDSCVAVTVFAHFRWFVTKSCKSRVDLSARKVKGKLQGVSFWCVNPRMAETCEVLMAVSESDMSHNVFFPCHDEGTQAWAYHEGCGTKQELEEIEDVRDHDCNLTVHEVPEACKIVILAVFLRDARLRSRVVDGNPGSRDVVFSDSKSWTVSGRRERTQREELQCQVENDTAEGLVVKTMKVLLVTVGSMRWSFDSGIESVPHD